MTNCKGLQLCSIRPDLSSVVQSDEGKNGRRSFRQHGHAAAFDNFTGLTDVHVSNLKNCITAATDLHGVSRVLLNTHYTLIKACLWLHWPEYIQTHNINT